MDDRFYLTLPQSCPTCGADNDGHYCTTELVGPPGPGSVSICAYCGTIGVYSETGIRLPTAEESASIADDAGVQQAAEMVKTWRRLQAWGRGELN